MKPKCGHTELRYGCGKPFDPMSHCWECFLFLTFPDYREKYEGEGPPPCHEPAKVEEPAPAKAEDYSPKAEATPEAEVKVDEPEPKVEETPKPKKRGGCGCGGNAARRAK
jgi:hypothetical protein